MPKKPNYRQERVQKTRAREAKKQEKQRRREEISTNRKAAQAEISNTEPEAAGSAVGHFNNCKAD